VHFYASSLLVFMLSAAISHVVDTPAFLYLMGAAVVYRLVMLVLLARDFVATQPAPRALDRVPVPAGADVLE
jgi:hypothetical protein